VTVLEIGTPHGPARAHVHAVADPAAVLMLGHGAGGSIQARDLVTVTEAALSVSVSVALIEQPYAVAGRRSPAPASQLDTAWTEVGAELRSGELRDLPLIAGGRSSGARVACRTAADTGAIAVLCLAFPVHPPGDESKTRMPELDAVRVPVLVVQGARDPFGMPPAAANREVVAVAATHSLATDLPAVAAAVREWLARVLVQAASE